MEAERLSQQKIYQDPDAYLQLLSLAAHLNQELGGLGRAPAPLQVEPGLLRRLHSLKGLFSLFLLDQAKSATHQLEGLLLPLLDAPGSLPQPAFGQALKEFANETLTAKKLLDALGEEMKLRLTGKVLSTDDFLDLKLMVQDLDQEGLEALIRRLEAQPARKLVELWPDEIDRLSRLLHKKVKLRLQGGGIELPLQLCRELSPLLLHLLRNAMDHGIEDPLTRKETGKDEFGIITVSFDKQGRNLKMIIADDGQGINLARVLAKARTKPQLDQAQVEALAASPEPWRILALPGFSMRERASEISGRGVGLNAIDDFLQTLGGRLDLETQPGQGTRFTVTIPLEA